MPGGRGRERGRACQAALVTAGRSNVQQSGLRKRDFRMVVTFSTRLIKRISPNADMNVMKERFSYACRMAWLMNQSPLGKLTK